MDNLNEWAANYMGEAANEVQSSIENEWYTRSFGAAAVVLHKAILDGKNCTLDMHEDSCAIRVGGKKNVGKLEQAPELILRTVKEAYDT